jgi:hypothetical protein
MRIPDAVHELVEWEIAIAYHEGYRAALEDVAAGHAELDAAWQPIGRRRYEQKVADRIAEMQRCARRLRAELDRRGRTGAGVPWPPVAVPGRPTDQAPRSAA